MVGTVAGLPSVPDACHARHRDDGPNPACGSIEDVPTVRGRPRPPALPLVLLLVSLLVVGAVVAVVVLAGTDRTGPGAPGPGAAGPGQTALAQLATLVVAGPDPRAGYARERFGDGWVDTDRNGCGTRDDVLARDLRDVTRRTGSCVVLSGELVDPYGGERIEFIRGRGTSEEVQIDHVVALSNAWRTGAQEWDAARRTRFANDPLELLAVDGPLNAAKGDGDAATWLPPQTGFHCRYVARQVAVKAVYGLRVTPAEQEAMARVLSTCPGELSPAPTLGR
ncbi:HNH endonuclease family protein [Kineococcus sp. TBRC 1896]|uniref:HNH endonuclease family protein n=1 Tax=Kineococcus mangrovi TaxID=1660183 RepID=A0ABV4HXZ5_9ACTN